MTEVGGSSSDPAAWHVLLGPLPGQAISRVSPLVPPPGEPTIEAGPLAGWHSLVVELSAGAAGVRILQVLVDGEGVPLSASDHVLFRFEPPDGLRPVQMRQESIGGRLESNGDFRGTCWLVTGPEPVDEEEPRWEMVPRQPTEGEVQALRKLVVEVVRRRPVP